jgi:hypothetical protein
LLIATATTNADRQDTPYSPYAHRDYPTTVYFGDTHHHTANSADAFMGGNRLTPEQAYRFALGDQVIASSGIPVKLSRPLDFLVISDHAEGLGVMLEVLNGNPAYAGDETLLRWSKMMSSSAAEAAAAANEVVAAQSAGTLPAPVTDPAVSGPIVFNAWKDYTATAEKFNEPGHFTAMIGFEWTSVPGGNNLHRNVLYRDGKDVADQAFPFTSWQSEDPEKLWAWMADFERRSGGRLLAIPHNGNLSNGRMFEVETFNGKPLTKDYATRRQRWEPLQEMMQTKGSSETHPGLSPSDEFADFGIAGWEYGNLTMTGSPETPAMRPNMYLRPGLQRGLEQERSIGVNPFKFGFIGGTDVHNSLSSIEEDNFFGKLVIQEPTAARWEHVSKEGFGKKRYTWHYSAAGYAAVWASDNTREALWDAMKRKEVYATSGTRMTVRFFGGWDFRSEDAAARDIAAAGYARGVPMGGDLPGHARGDADAPTFLVAALKDPLFGNLDRIQIVKGWLDADGKSHEKIYDVAWSDAEHRTIRADGKLTPVGNTVDIDRATWTDTIGEVSLEAAWTDPDFDPAQAAFYYARVLEIPTPTWQAYDRLRFRIEMDDELPMTHQERAWSSPIWYTP